MKDTIVEVPLRPSVFDSWRFPGEVLVEGEEPAPLIWSDLNAKWEANNPGARTNGQPFYAPARTKVAIMGSEYSRRLAPLADPEWDVWTLNNIAPRLNDGSIRVDRWFEIHYPGVRTEDVWKAHETIPQPVYVTHPEDAHLPTAVTYPMEAILAAGYRDYFVDSFAYEIALAMFEGYTTIGLFGAHLLTGSPRERTVEAACVSWWAGLAEGRGIDVVIPKVPWGLRQHPYQYGLDAEAERMAVGCYTAAMHRADDALGYLDSVANGRMLHQILGA